MTNPLFQEELQVVNVGLAGFAEAITAAGGQASQVEWAPPGEGDPAMARKLAGLIHHPVVDAANRQAFDNYLSAQPVVEGVAAAGTVVPGLAGHMILHSGPPIEWARMCGPVQGAIVGAILYEGWASTRDDADSLAADGGIVFAPCHHHGAVGPMAGVISPSMPVWSVVDREHGGRTFCNLNEGLGKVLRFGANGPDVIARLRWMAEVLAPTLASALERLGGIELKPLMAQALHMGDEVHNRNVAASSLLLKRLLPGLLRSPATSDQLAAVTEFVAGNDHFFLNLSMAACKAMLDAAAGIEGSSMVTAMARNGVDFGVRLSGTGDRWFIAAAPVVDGLFFPGYSTADAAPDLGDSAITETAGVGGFAMAAAPAIVQFVGGAPQDALANTLEMSHITLGRNGGLTLPALEFAGTPAGIDARKVVDTGIAPIINTGIAHREAGIGQIGAGITRAPLVCFARAIGALADRIDRGEVGGGGPTR